MATEHYLRSIALALLSFLAGSVIVGFSYGFAIGFASESNSTGQVETVTNLAGLGVLAGSLVAIVGLVRAFGHYLKGVDAVPISASSQYPTATTQSYPTASQVSKPERASYQRDTISDGGHLVPANPAEYGAAGSKAVARIAEAQSPEVLAVAIEEVVALDKTISTREFRKRWLDSAKGSAARICFEGDLDALEESIQAEGRKREGKFFSFNTTATANDGSLVSGLLVGVVRTASTR